MALSLRPTGFASTAFADRADYVVIEDGEKIGRIYEDRYTSPDFAWFWSITVYVDPMLRIVTHGKTPSLQAAKNGTM